MPPEKLAAAGNKVQLLKSFWVKGKKVTLSNAFVDGALAISDRASIGKVAGERRYIHFCLNCKRIRTGVMVKHGFLKCDECGFVPRW